MLDEPSIGLHQRDNDRLIQTLKNLRDLGNTVLVVEHDEDTIAAADYLVDVGPGAGVHGGEIVAYGTPAEVAHMPQSITGRYLSGAEKIPVPAQRRPIEQGRALIIRGARENNLKNIDVTIPLGVLTLVTGVSGSGKSTLVNSILASELTARLHRAQAVPGAHDAIDGSSSSIKQLSSTSRQLVAPRAPTLPPILVSLHRFASFFAGTPEANIRGYKPGRFSFNVKGGRCEHCQGDGVIKIEMHFLPDVYIQCPECHGKRYNREALEITYKGKTISDVLDMTVEQACEFFANIPAICSQVDDDQRSGPWLY